MGIIYICMRSRMHWSDAVNESGMRWGEKRVDRTKLTSQSRWQGVLVHLCGWWSAVSRLLDIRHSVAQDCFGMHFNFMDHHHFVVKCFYIEGTWKLVSCVEWNWEYIFGRISINMFKRNARKLQKNIIPSINEMINVPIPQLPLHELCHFIICRVYATGRYAPVDNL